jgi:hypothetical protein
MLQTNLEATQQLNTYQSLSQTQTEKLEGLEEILHKLGLQLSPSDLNYLSCGKFVSLEHLTLADLGITLILASAIAAQNFQQKNACFRDLLLLKGSSDSFGIPLYCWDDNESIKCYLRLTFITGIPTIVIQNCVS